jgi:hypothetical protein
MWVRGIIERHGRAPSVSSAQWSKDVNAVARARVAAHGGGFVCGALLHEHENVVTVILVRQTLTRHAIHSATRTVQHTVTHTAAMTATRCNTQQHAATRCYTWRNTLQYNLVHFFS